MQSADQMGEPVGEAFRAMVERVERHFGKTDLAFSQWLTLKLIGSGRIARVSDVNRELGLQGAAATRLIDRLERRGFLIRKRSRSDRRVVNIIATEAGEAIVEAMQPRLWAFWTTQVSIIPRADREQLSALLSRLHTARPVRGWSED